MKVKILLFGMLIDGMGTSTLIIENVQDTDELKKELEKQHPFLKKMSYRIAVNQQIISKNTELKDGDEIALMPPFAGG